MQLDNPDDRLDAAKQMIKSQPEALETQIRGVGGLNKKEASLELFQYWMRQYTSLSSGSIVDYRKYVAEFLDENGELDALNDLGSHKQAAVNKYRKFLQTDTSEFDFSKKNGDNSE